MYSEMLPSESQSSLPYQILLYLNGWYLAFFMIVEMLIYVFKTFVLPYPPGNIVAEVFLLVFFGSIDAVRIFMGKKGNLTERIISLLISIIFTAPSVLAMLYLLLWQTYVLKIEIILISITIIFEGIELVFALLTVVAISKSG
nr:transmembrane protein 216-like [Procambarus clarkii]